MSIKYLDGKRLYRVIHAGLQKVLAREDYLNKINVFPVPDGDTGTNMAYTLTAIQEGISEADHPDVNEMSQKIADSALDGARGNSGVILAQFLVGLAEGLKDRVVVSTEQFSQAVHTARERAYEALIEPQEGTILTVIREWSESIQEHARERPDFREVLHNGLKRAQTSLKETRNKLEVLRKADVVDAGAQGFVYLLEGIQDFISSGKISQYVKKIRSEKDDALPVEHAEFNEKYRYCTECTISNSILDRKALQDKIQHLGDSVVIAGNREKLKVHIHTDTPRDLFEICAAAGTVTGEKADDMLQQQKDASSEHKAVGLVIDSTCDLPPEMVEQFDLHTVPVKLSFGDEHYVDQIGMTADEFWSKTAVSPHHPKTSQPSPGNFIRQYQLLLNNFDSVLSIQLTSGASGTYQSAVTAAKSLPDKNIVIIDSKNVSVGIGLIVIAAGEAIQAGKSLEEVTRVVNQAVENTRIYIGLESLDFVVRGGRVPAFKKKIADRLRMFPVLTIGKEGNVTNAGQTFGAKDRPGKLVRWVKKRLDPAANYRLGVAYTTDVYVATQVAHQLKEITGNEDIFVCRVGPALGVHAGPGAIAIAVQKLEEQDD